MKHAPASPSQAEVASVPVAAGTAALQLDVCDILDISTREHKFLGVSIEPFSYCFTCNMSLLKAVVMSIFTDLVSNSPARERPKPVRASHAVFPD